MFERGYILLALGFTFCGAHDPWTYRRLIGGNIAASGQFPYQVSVREDGLHACGGAILGPRWVITAGHCCVETQEGQPAVSNIKAGLDSINDPGQSHDVERTFIHPEFMGSSGTNDICLIKLKTNLVLFSLVQSISFAYSIPQPGDNVIITGWGFSQNGANALSDQLRYQTFKIEDYQKCKAFFRPGTIFPTNVCTVGTPGKGPCTGDSGGPVVIADGDRYYLVAIVSAMSDEGGCASGQPDIHTLVEPYRVWIDRTIADNTYTDRDANDLRRYFSS